MLYTACKSLAKMCRLFHGVSHFDLEGWQMYPQLDFVGGRIPPWNYKYIKKIVYLPILNGFERSIHVLIGIDTYNFSKIAVIFNFYENMPQSWILCVFVPFKKKILFYFTCITAQFLLQILMHHTHLKRASIEHNLVSLPIISLLWVANRAFWRKFAACVNLTWIRGFVKLKNSKNPKIIWKWVGGSRSHLDKK